MHHFSYEYNSVLRRLLDSFIKQRYISEIEYSYVINGFKIPKTCISS